MGMGMGGLGLEIWDGEVKAEGRGTRVIVVRSRE